MTDFNSRLTGELRSHANTLPMPDIEISLILTAGARRQSRRRRATMISTLAAVGACSTVGTVAILNQQSADKNHRQRRL